MGALHLCYKCQKYQPKGYETHCFYCGSPSVHLEADGIPEKYDDAREDARDLVERDVDDCPYDDRDMDDNKFAGGS